MNEPEKKYPEGHFIGLWIGIGIAIFSGISLPLTIALDIPGLTGIGPAIGVSIGVAIGASIEAKHKKEGRIRPLNEKEKKNRKILVYAGTALLVIGLLVLILVFTKSKQG